MGLVGFVLAVPGALAGIVWLLIPNYDSSGLDFEVVGPSLWQQLLAGGLPVATLVLFVLTIYWARKKWAGYLILGLGLSLVVGIVGLVFTGVI